VAPRTLVHLSPEHGQLVAQDHDLEVFLSLAPSAQSEQLKETLELA
jgi:hypothetical protein